VGILETPPEAHISEAGGDLAKPLSYMEQNKYTIPFMGDSYDCVRSAAAARFGHAHRQPIVARLGVQAQEIELPRVADRGANQDYIGVGFAVAANSAQLPDRLRLLAARTGGNPWRPFVVLVGGPHPPRLPPLAGGGERPWIGSVLA
jgi:hypothetical protein